MRHARDDPGSPVDALAADAAFRAVLVNTGATALMRMAGNALAYCTVVMFSAVFDGG